MASALIGTIVLQEGLRAVGNTEVLKKIVTPRSDLSKRRQCELLGLNRSMLYYKPTEGLSADLALMRLMDEEYLEHPTKGVLGMVDFLSTLGIVIGPKRVRRLLRKMGIMAIYPRRNLSKLGLAKYIRSYKLSNLEITHSNQVWCIDNTYIPMQQGFLYLTAIIYANDIWPWWNMYTSTNHAFIGYINTSYILSPSEKALSTSPKFKQLQRITKEEDNGALLIYHMKQ